MNLGGLRGLHGLSRIYGTFDIYVLPPFPDARRRPPARAMALGYTGLGRTGGRALARLCSFHASSNVNIHPRLIYITYLLCCYGFSRIPTPNVV